MAVTFEALALSTPADQGVSAQGIEAFLDAVESTPGVEPHSLMILRHGYVIAAGWWWPYTPERVHLLYALSKSFTSTAAGLAVADGLIGLDDSVIAYFPELEPEIEDARSRSMLVRHIAAMSSGHLEDTWQRVMAPDPEEPVRAFLLLAPDRDPGTVFAYNQSATYTLGAIVQRVTGQTMTQYLRSRLLDPVGAGATSWLQHPAGRDLGFSGLHATTDTIARLGQLYLRGGSWHGRQLLAPEWVAQATRSQISTARPADPVSAQQPDWQQGYGFQFWMSRHGYRGDGAYGQFCVVLPEQDAVIVMTGQTTAMQAVLDAAWQELLPAFAGRAGRPSKGADSALEDRLSQLAIPAQPARSAPPAGGERWDHSVFRPAGRLCEEQASLLGVRVSAEGGAWSVALEEAEWRLTVLLGESWVVASSAAAGDDAVPHASSGGWLDDDTLRLDVIFLETPHRLVVTCSLPDRTFEARWMTAPLHPGRLRDLHAPGPLGSENRRAPQQT
jgi:CubicO group peptidase (beta-lactamase class C family)